jgi:integrase
MYGDWTVREYAARWIAARVAHGLVCAGDDGARLRIHAMPIIGHLKMHEVEQRHIRDLMRMLRADGKLAPRSVRHLYAVLHTMFRDALIDGAIRSNPCVLRRGDLPKQVDKDPTWRVGAVFTRDELERLISDRRVPEDRRTFYALLGLTGLRFGEAAALRWRSYDATLEPLGRLLVASSWSTRGRLERATKTEQPRLVPVHPVLAKILARWKSDGWRSIMGRLPEPDDLLIPSRRGVHRSRYRTLKTFYKDADRLGMRRPN